MLLLLIMSESVMIGLNAGLAIVENSWFHWVMTGVWILNVGWAAYAYMWYECFLRDTERAIRHIFERAVDEDKSLTDAAKEFLYEKD